MDFSRAGAIMKPTAKALFLSHGGGPLPLLGDAAHSEMVALLKEIAGSMEKPSAIIVVSAHWEENIPTITANQNPSLLYDYGGFPEESYHIKYPCPGSPSLAKAVSEKLSAAGISNALNDSRGLDHGVFVPLKIMYPEADIPCIQLSLLRNLNSADHVKLGEALGQLEMESLLLIGSGFSFHNMRAFFTPDTTESKAMNHAFEQWLLDTCANKNISESERKQKLVDWEKAPSACYCHPREEHLLPLHVCYGFTGSACSTAYTLKILNKESSIYLW